MKIKWFGHASFGIYIEEKVVYIDPYQLPDSVEKADLILVSHGHYDHCDKGEIERLLKEDTLIMAPENIVKKINHRVDPMKAGDKCDIGWVKVEAVPAHNVGKSFHPVGLGLGLILEAEGKRIYYAGDTDFIPEMENLKEITIALLPVCGTFTMNPEDALKAVQAISPEIAIPMHYGSVVGSKEDAEKFKKLVEEKTKTRVEILDGGELEL